MHRLDAEFVRGREVFVPAQAHVVDLWAQALVELASEREALRLGHGGREDGGHHHPPARSRQMRQRAARREHGVVEMG